MTMTDDELIAVYSRHQESRSFATRTIKRRRTSLVSFSRFLEPGSLATAKPDDIEEWLTSLKAANSRHAYRSDLACFYRWAVRRELLVSDPVLKTDPIRTPRPMPKPAPMEAIAAAFSAADRDVQLMLMLGALAGLRRSEIACLAAEDCHLDAEPPVLHVRNSKGAKDRVVPLHPMLVQMLRGRIGWLFKSPGSRSHLSPVSVGVRLSKALSNGDQHVTAHQLRHYFGTEAARWADGNVLLVAQLMGHSSPSTTMGYIGWSPTEGAEVVSKIAGAEQTADELAERRRAREAS